MKQLHDTEITLIKVVWEGPSGESTTWEREDQMKESYPDLFPSGKFLVRKFFEVGRVVTPQKLN